MSHQIILSKNSTLENIIKNLKNENLPFLNIKTGERFSEYLLLKNGSRNYFSASKDIDISGMIDYNLKIADHEYDMMIKKDKNYTKIKTRKEYQDLILLNDLVPPYFYDGKKLIKTLEINKKDRLDFMIKFIGYDNEIIQVFDLY